MGIFVRLVAMLFALSAGVHAMDAPGKDAQKTDKGDGGSWRVIDVHPDLPGPGPTHADRFQLDCKSQSPELKEMKIQIQVSANGAVYVAATDGNQIEANVYVNAFLWHQGDDIYAVDRFNGVLTIKPNARSYQCEKIGGRKF